MQTHRMTTRLVSLLLPLLSVLTNAQTTTINSPSFDFVRRVNYGTATSFVADSANFSTYAIGNTNSAQQSWFRVKNAVATAAAGREISSATLVFRSGSYDSAPRTVYLARTTLAATAAADRTTYDGTNAYPSVPGTSSSFSGAGYLLEPIAVAIDATGAGSVDVTDWVKNHPDDVWFLTNSPAPAGTSVTSASGANWGSLWHWENSLSLNGGTESPVQLLLDFSLPNDSPPVITSQLPARAAHYAGEPFSISVTAATGTAALSYEWRKNGVIIEGATSPNLSFTPLNLADGGDYQVTVSNIHGSVTSTVCDLTVIAHPDLAGFTPPPASTTRYHAQGNAVIGINQGRYFNRPLYINNTNAFVLTGDKPMAKFASGGNQHGKFFVGIIRGGTTKWLHNCAEIRAAFQPAHTTWRVTDPAFPGLAVKLEITALAGTTSFAARATASGAQAGDKLVWAYGGSTVPGGNLNTNYDPYRIGESPLLTESFSPSAATNNVASVLTGSLTGAFSVVPSSGSTSITFGRCSVGSYRLGNASSWTTPASLIASSASTQPLICGEISLDTTPAATWSFTRLSSLPSALPDYSEPNTAFTSGLLRSADFASRLLLETPEPRLDAAAATAVAGVDGTWYGNKFVHGAMSWNGAYLGWRTTIGGTMLGWHDRVKTSADYYLATQKATSSYTSGEAMGGSYLLTKPASTSRFYGKGYVVQDQTFYEMQTQYFDQILQDWRWRPVDDPAHEAKLRSAVELHLERARECYDPDNNGTYESVINTWPTDSIWFNGGGCPDATAYAYRGHQFARDLALRARDSAAAAIHEARLSKIRNAFFTELWVSENGHPGLFREQGGHQRLINNPWLYSLCLPIEAGMLTPEQAASTLHYAEYGLENLAMPAGGRQVITANFTPSIWSTRVLWPGDNYMLAQSYFQSGFSRDGWEVLRGTIFQSGFNDLVPGDSSVLVGGSDFGDCVHTLTRTIVEGLFGYQPDFPNGKTRIAPQFPADWQHASMKTPVARLGYVRGTDSTTLTVRLQRATTLEIEIPVRAMSVSSVTIDGAPAAFTTASGIGCTLVRVSTPASAGVTRTIVVNTGSAVAEAMPIAIEGVTGSPVNLTIPGAAIVSFSDPQGALQNATVSGGTITGTLTSNLGRHRVFAAIGNGSLAQTRIFNLSTLADPATPSTTLPAVPGGATWATVNMGAQLTANITQIYEQQYLSPRPATISSRVGTDGYSPWTFPHWGLGRPTISINNTAGMLDPGDNTRLLTPQGVPFRWGGSTSNVAFTSLWDNWPDSVTVPVNQAAEAAWFLICGSTTVMQNRISNAVIRLRYSDDVEETLELIPPYNYWNLSPISGRSTSDQFGGSDYTQDSEVFMVPKPWPMTVQLGTNCRAMLLNRKLRPGVQLTSVTLEAMSQESVIGLMGVTLMNPVNNSGPLGVTNPSSVSAVIGGSANFRVTASGQGPYSYEWFKVGSAEVIGTGATLELTNIGAGDIGSYYAVVSNGSESVTSAAAMLSPFAGFAWDGIDGSWNAAANWSTTPDAATPDPTGPPTAADDVLFNINPAGFSTAVTLDADTTARSLAVNTPGTVILSANASGTVTRTLVLGAGGIDLRPGAGALTLGAQSNGLGVMRIVLDAAQSWTNDSAAPLAFHGYGSGAMAVDHALELAGSGDFTITGQGNSGSTGIFSGNGGITKTENGNLTVGNLFNNNRFTIGQDLGGPFRMEHGTLLISPTSYMTLGENTGGNATASYTQTGGSATYTGSSGLYIGNWTGGTNNTATFSIEGGSFTQNSNITYVGRQTGSGSATGRLVIGGSSVPASFTSPTISIGGAAANSINTGEVILRSQGTLLTGLIQKPGGTAHLLFDGGTLRVRPGTGNGSTLLANVLDSATLTSLGATIDTNGTDVTIAQGFADAASGSGTLTKSGAGTLTLSGQHIYSGDTSVAQGTLALASSGKITLRPLANGQSNKITGAGEAVINGTIHLDLTASALANGHRWTLVNSATKSFGTTFSLTSTLAVPFQKSGGEWTAVDGERTWSFDETTGVLKLAMPTAYSLWIGNFTIRPSDQRGPAHDPDNDGASNLEEFAFDGDPTNPSDHGKQHLLSTEPRHLVLTVAMRENTPAFSGSPAPSSSVDGIAYQVQGSDDLGTFARPVIEITPLVPGSLAAPRAGYTYRSFALETEDAQGFLRVRVVEQGN